MGPLVGPSERQFAAGVVSGCWWSETEREACLAGEDSAARAFDGGEQILNGSSSRSGCCLSFEKVEHSLCVGVQHWGEELVGSDDLNLIALEAIAQVAPIVGNEIVGVGGYARAHTWVSAGSLGQTSEVKAGSLAEVDAPRGEVLR
ncbi:MAG TPA: hypothetical protein VHU13_00680 [Solirubrobacteraceae bacterium]|jgi:hypothetical protein|nr:hypothetical protein [Solirubrobacteraceae bacterium]